MHVKGSHLIARHRSSSPAALILFDIIAADDDVLLQEPWKKRRARLLKEIGKSTSDQIRITESIEGDGEKMLNLAQQTGMGGNHREAC